MTFPCDFSKVSSACKILVPCKAPRLESTTAKMRVKKMKFIVIRFSSLQQKNKLIKKNFLKWKKNYLKKC